MQIFVIIIICFVYRFSLVKTLLKNCSNKISFIKYLLLLPHKIVQYNYIKKINLTTNKPQYILKARNFSKNQSMNQEMYFNDFAAYLLVFIGMLQKYLYTLEELFKSI